MRPIIIIGFSVFPSFVFLSFWCRDICVTVGIDSSWLLSAGLEGPVHVSWRETLLWSIETHSQAQQLQINFLCCGQSHPSETQRALRAGLKLCLVHGRGKLWDSLSYISLTTEMSVSNSRAWDEGKQTQHVSRWLDVDTLAILPAITASLLPPRLPHKSRTLLLVLLRVLLQILLLQSHSGSRRERDRLTDQHSLLSGTVCNTAQFMLLVFHRHKRGLELIYIRLLVTAIWVWLNGIRLS